MSEGSEAELVVCGRRVVTPEGVRPARVCIEAGVIRAVEELEPGDRVSDLPAAPDTSNRVIDAGDAVVMAGVVDTHVHVNEPGRTDWEGFRSATDAAAAGGVTTLVDMPLNCSPVTTDVAALEAKAASAEGRCRVDVGFWGGAVPGNVADLAPLADAGVLGFKCFLCPSGLDEFPPLGAEGLEEALAVVAALDRPLLVHAELPERLREPDVAADGRTDASTAYADYLATRPPEADVEAVALLVRGARETEARVHVVHLAASAALEPIRRGRGEGVAVTVETCPHYLTFAAEEVPDGDARFKCAPPIREAREREALWRALDEGAIDLVASDHSPCPPAMKATADGGFHGAWGGIASIQLSLPATWTAARDRGHGVADLARWMCEGPARLAGLEGRKGRIAPGLDADLVIWEPEEEWTVRGADLRHRHPVTPYEGRTLAGRVRRTLVRGETVYEEGRLGETRPGRTLRRRAA